MNLQEYIEQKKIIQNNLLEFIEKDEDTEAIYQNLLQCFNDMKILEDQYEIKSTLYIISNIANNHHRCLDFFNKLEKVLLFFKDSMKNKFTSVQIYDIFQSNNRILLFLLQEGILTITEQSIYSFLENNPFNQTKSLVYFLPEIKQFFPNGFNGIPYLNEYQPFYEKLPDDFDEKRKIGENDTFLCEVIRKDSIEQFITYVKTTNLELNSRIEESIYETNSNFLNEKPTLIEYASFFGSIQIFRYLHLNEIELRPILWSYGIHGDNPEILHFLEEKKLISQPQITEKPIQSNDESEEEDIDFLNTLQLFEKVEENFISRFSYQDCLKEAVKCHHNEIANYILTNYLEGSDMSLYDFDENITSYCFHFYNFSMLKNDADFVTNEWLLSYASQFDHYKIVDFLIKTKNITTIQSPIPNKFFFSLCFNFFFIFKIFFYFCEILFQFLNANPLYLAAKNNHIDVINLLFTIPNISIGYGFFENCNKLTHITIPSSVTKIGDKAFKQCTSLREVTIPESVIEMGGSCFKECFSLIKVSLFCQITEIKNYSFSECNALKKLDLPLSVTKIGTNAFEGCESLFELTIPLSVTEIGVDAFKGCISLEKVTIPAVRVISKNCFEGCSHLKKAVIPNSVVSIRNEAFFDCFSLSEVFIPDSVSHIGSSAFAGCCSLTEVVIPSSVNSLGFGVFDRCQNLRKISLKKSLLNYLQINQNIEFTFL